VTAGSATAFADERDLRVLDHWVPSFALFGGVTVQDVSGDVSSFDGSGMELMPADEGDDTAVTPLVGGSLELMSPGLRSLPLEPRVFVAAELSTLFGSERSVASDGNPNGPVFPDRINFSEVAIGGVGSRTIVQYDTLSYGAGAGLVFGAKIGDYQLRFKPSVRWLRYSLDVDGTVLRAIKPDVNDPFVRVVRLTDSDGLDVDGLGPGLEVELALVRRRSLLVSVFAGVNGYRVLGDREVRLSDSVTILDEGEGLPTETYTAEWNAEIDPWIVRGTVGLRFSWISGGNR
jgi:hypothetical protein